MKTLLTLTTLFFLSANASFAQTILWDRTYGGTNLDNGTSIVATPDGGYLLGGYSTSDAGYEKSASKKSGEDFWLIKTNNSGNKLWDKTYSGSGSENLKVILPTSDGNYLLGGDCAGGIGFEKSEISRGGEDFWLVKIDGDGNLLWEKTIGGPGDEYLSDIIETDDGGFLVGGVSFGLDLGIGYEKTVFSHNYSEDYWIVKIDANGNKLWDKIYGGEKYESLSQIIKTHDGNYLLVGSSNSPASYEKSEEPKGGFDYDYDYWLVKIDPDGNQLWDKTIGGSESDFLEKAIPTSDGKFLLGGTSSSNQGFDKSENRRGSSDYWLMKVNATGDVEWDRTYGGTESNQFSDLLVTHDTYLILVGSSTSPASYEKSQANKGQYNDYWIIKTTFNGDIEWDTTIGGSESDYTNDAILDRQGNLLVLGYSYSPISGDKSQSNRGLGTPDYWLVKVKMPRNINPELLLDIREEHLVATCWHCHIWPSPWELWQNFQYRFWPVERGVKNATYRYAFRGGHRDKVAWVDETSLSIRLHDKLPPGEYQFQLRAQLRDGSYSDWLEPVAFTIEGMDVKVFPNPVRDLLNIHYQAPRQEVVRIVLMNRYGKTLWAEKRAARQGSNLWRMQVPKVQAHHNPLTLQLFIPTQGKQSWQLIRE